MERWEAKVVAIFVLFAVTTFFTALPIVVSNAFLRKGAKGQRIIRILNCFGGGVFFGAYLLHQTPEVRAILNSSLLIPNHIEYALPEFFIGMGFFLLVFIEKAIHHVSTKSSHSNVAPVELKTVNGNNGTENGAAVAVISNGDMGKELPMDAQDQHGHSHNLDTSGGALKSVILLIALSLDCIFEGMALGLQREESGVWNLMVAILSHEFVIAFTLGLQLTQYNSKKRVLFLAFLYGVTAPTGVAIGTAIYETGGGSNDVDIVSGILQALSAGVFIYCTFIEILAGEITQDAPFANLVAAFLGYGLMCVLGAVPHHHDHGDGDHDHDHDHDHKQLRTDKSYYYPRPIY